MRNRHAADHARSRGFTIVELLVAVVIVSVVTLVAFRIWSYLRRGSEEVSENARYYQVVGRFMAQFKMDVRAAGRIRREGDDLVMTLNTEDFARDKDVRYAIETARHRITRIEEGASSVFDFGAPPAGAGPFVFRID